MRIRAPRNSSGANKKLINRNASSAAQSAIERASKPAKDSLDLRTGCPPRRLCCFIVCKCVTTGCASCT
eukprot:4278882-Pyramimonas_sp.AAC.1